MTIIDAGKKKLIEVALPLEAQRLGLESYASDLTPVAVLINKAMIEIPPRFAGRPPVHPDGSGDGKSGTVQGGLFKREPD